MQVLLSAACCRLRSSSIYRVHCLGTTGSQRSTCLRLSLSKAAGHYGCSAIIPSLSITPDDGILVAMYSTEVDMQRFANF